MKPSERFQVVKRLDRCRNCLKDGHIIEECPSKVTCRTPSCNEQHHTTLHEYCLKLKYEEDRSNETSKEKKEVDKTDGRK